MPLATDHGVVNARSKAIEPSFSSQKPALPNLLYLGEVPVESSYHGSAALYRLLKAYPASRLCIIEQERRVSRPERRLPGVRYEHVAGHWRWGGQVVPRRLPLTYWPLWNVLSSWWRRAALKVSAGFRPEAVLTVLDGTLWLAAIGLARKLQLPFHLILHDDWFRGFTVGSSLRQKLEEEFGAIYREATGRFCVSPYMEETFRARYGAAGDILYPARAADAPEFSAPPERLLRNTSPFTVAYAGSSFDGGYLEALQHLAHALSGLPARLLLFGPFSAQEAERNGLNPALVECRGLLSSAQLISVLRQEADALFLPMSFLDRDKDTMTLGFPSKLTDYTTVGLPLIICGPPYSSVVRWARENHGVGAVLDSQDEAVLKDSLVRLMGDAALRHSLATKALEAGRNYFSHEAVTRLFYESLCGKRPQN